MRKGRKPTKILIAALVLGICVTVTGISMVRHYRSIIKDEQTTESLQEASTGNEEEAETETAASQQTDNASSVQHNTSAVGNTVQHNSPAAGNTVTNHTVTTEPEKTTEEVAKPQPTKPTEEAAKPQPAKPTAEPAKPQPAQPTEEPAKPQPAPEPATEAEKEKAYETVWVVDKDAWTETVPKYETHQRSICNGCGADISGYAAEHTGADPDDGCYGFHTEPRTEQVGTETIEHPEEGHWEQREIER